MAAYKLEYVLEPDGPTLTTFYSGDPHWSNPPVADGALIAGVEDRLDIILPDILKDLYLEQNGGRSDFMFTAITPDSPLAPQDDFFDYWRGSLPDDGLRPVGDLLTMTSLQKSFDYDPDYDWGRYLPGAHHLVRIGQQAWDVYLCLDYSSGPDKPGVVLFDDARWDPESDAPFEARWPDFRTFFSSLRRLTLREDNGVLCRGVYPAGPRDRQENGLD